MAGIRERKKERTRRALSTAAVRLCRDRGWAAVTAEDVATEADVSVRTFANYFPHGKAEAIAALHLDRLHAVAEALAERPAGEPLAEAVIGAVLPRFVPDAGAERPPDVAALAGLRFVLTTPELSAEVLRANAIAEPRLAAAVAARTGDPPDALRPALTAAVLVAATGVALDRWLRSDPPVALGPLLRDALGPALRGLDPAGDAS